MTGRCNPLAAMLLFAASAAHAAFPACTFEGHALDTGADPLGHVRMAVRADGRPLLVFTTAVSNASTLDLFDCDDPTCASGHVTPLDASFNYFNAPGIAMRRDGRPVVVASWYGGLRYYDCQDAACSLFPPTEIVPTGSAVLSDSPVVLQPNGNPAFAYIDDTRPTAARPGYLIVYLCDDSGCTSGTEHTLAMPGDEASTLSNLSIAIDADGRITATYLASEGATNRYDYHLARCSDAACTTVSDATIAMPIGNASPFRTALALRSDARPLALDSQSTHTAIIDCTAASCLTFSDRALPTASEIVPIGLALLAGDRPAFATFAPASAGAFACADVACTAGTAVVAITNTTASVLDADFALDATQRPLIAYIDFSTRKLSAAGCVDTLFADGFD